LTTQKTTPINRRLIGREVFRLIERMGSLLRAKSRAFGKQHGLQPVQLEALTYLTRSNRYSDTPQVTAEFLGLTKGTVSQSLKVLEKKGLVMKKRDPGDRRLVHLRPTQKGRRLIEYKLSRYLVARGFTTTASSANKDTLELLRRLLRVIQITNNLKSFGTCQTCRYNHQANLDYFCKLTKEPLNTQDLHLLCHKHEYLEEEKT
jgi:DNA-binding MarR family transcriptional regulator